MTRYNHKLQLISLPLWQACLPYRKAVLLTLAVAMFLLLAGCGSSRLLYEEDDLWTDEWIEEEPTPVAVTEEPVVPPVEARLDDKQDQIDQLQRDNQQLRQEVARLAQENRNLNARIAEMEKKVMEEQQLRAQAIEEARREARETAPAPRVAPTMSEQAFEREYNRAFTLYMDRNYEEAKNLFSELLKTGVDHPLLANCQYWIGESLFGMQRYEDAIEAFRKVFDFPVQIKFDDAQIMIANSYMRLGDRQRARQEFQRLIDRYPNSEYVALAQQRVRALQ